MIATVRLTLGLSAAAIAALLLACGGEEPAPAPPSGKAQGQMASKARAGETITKLESGATLTSGSDLELPDNFPKDVPVYPKAKVTVALTAPGGGVMASFESSDDAQAVIDFYKEQLVAKGWTLDNEIERSRMVQIDSSSGGRRLTTTVARSGPTTKFTVTMIQGS